MIKLENTSVMNFDNAIRGARNPMNSWDKLDSSFDANGNFVFGPNDLSLGKKLCKAGSDHRKFVRQIFISVDITAPIYWWKEFDTYKVGTVANSTSTMHKIHSKPFELSDFSTDKMNESALNCMQEVLKVLENLRQDFIEDKSSNKESWYSIIQLLPESYNQKRTVTLNYENVISMYYSRRNHKLSEWHVFCDWILDLPYFKELFSLDENE
ncbi:MAG: hypothetical protein UH788_05240 [Treponemataceae bacterium]|nr:hypothetical protein [Treponemataceae bacterium]